MPLSVCQLCYQRSCSFAAAEIVLVLINAQRAAAFAGAEHQKRNSIQLTVLVSFSFGFVNWTLYWRSPCPGICFKGDHSTKHPSSVMLLTLGAAKMKKKKCIFRPRWWCKECIYFVLWAPPLLFKNVVGFLKIHHINVSIRFKICTFLNSFRALKNFSGLWNCSYIVNCVLK